MHTFMRTFIHLWGFLCVLLGMHPLSFCASPCHLAPNQSAGFGNLPQFQIVVTPSSHDLGACVAPFTSCGPEQRALRSL